jgi:hypothetical protein
MGLVFALLFIFAIVQLVGISKRSKRLLELCEGLKRSNGELREQLKTLGDRVARMEYAMGLSRTTALTTDTTDVALPVPQSDAPVSSNSESRPQTG